MCKNDQESDKKMVTRQRRPKDRQEAGDEISAQFLPVAIKMADALDDEWWLEEKDVENTGKLSH